jgi:hypothetical protein
LIAWESAYFEIPVDELWYECTVHMNSIYDQWNRNYTKAFVTIYGQFVTDVVAIKIPI